MRLNLKMLSSIIVVLILIVLNLLPQVFSQWFAQLQRFVLEGGLLAFLLVMVLQSIVSIVPAEVVLMLGGSAFGFLASSVMGLVGLMAGALINYGIGLRLGKPIVEKLVGKRELKKVETLFDKHGHKVIFAIRFIPWVSFDAISYFSGIVGVSLIPFIVATLFGTLLRSTFYSYLGEKIGSDLEKGNVEILNYLLLITFFTIILLLVLSERKPSRGHSEAV
jgi:uncharacterized membrane protein YdjX (TVP38/TMEM64 family)